LLIEVKVTPNARHFSFRFERNWRASVTSRPEKGAANRELEKELGKLLGCGVRVVRGASARRKVLEVALSEEEFKMRAGALREGEPPGQNRAGGDTKRND
jgi:uncharacterized protein (TIGR00251 family)